MNKGYLQSAGLAVLARAALSVLSLASLQAQTTDVECQKTRELISAALETADTRTHVLDSLDVFTDCFDVVYDVYNNYDGATDQDPYQDFLDALIESVADQVVRQIVTRQHLAAVKDSFGEEGLEFVNSISFVGFKIGGELLHVIESGWGDDDFYYYHVFTSNGTEPLIVFSW